MLDVQTLYTMCNATYIKYRFSNLLFVDAGSNLD